MNLSAEQLTAIDTILAWFKSETKQEFKLGGYAGTGKTTIIKEILAKIQSTRSTRDDDDEHEEPRHHAVQAAIVAYTGKAVSILRKKGLSEAQTIHSLIYIPQKEKDGRMTWHLRESLDFDLLIVDEASMISAELYHDLISFDIPILWVGDPGQLEPIGSDVALMKDLDYTLYTIHRQGEGSLILEYATSLRMGNNGAMWLRSRGCAPEMFKPELHVARYAPKFSVSTTAQLLCGFNKTRVSLNTMVRRLLNHSGAPKLGEKLVCLRNNINSGVFNGQLFEVTKVGFVTGNIIRLNLRDELGQTYYELPVWLPQFNLPSTIEPRDIKVAEAISKTAGILQFDYGYALTVHKAQGSEWDEVVVIEEIWEDKWQPSRWRYTAATRASKKLTYYYK